MGQTRAEKKGSYPHTPSSPTLSSLRVWEEASEAVLSPDATIGYWPKGIEEFAGKVQGGKGLRGWMRDWVEGRSLVSDEFDLLSHADMIGRIDGSGRRYRRIHLDIVYCYPCQCPGQLFTASYSTKLTSRNIQPEVAYCRMARLTSPVMVSSGPSPPWSQRADSISPQASD